MQLTGIRIPDPVIKSSNSAQALLRQLITPPKPNKVVDALKQKSYLVELPNVIIYGRRQTPVDKERKVGRWKVIEKELRERGLPVFGKQELNSMSVPPAFSRSR
jgi:Ribosomal subunit 39S